VVNCIREATVPISAGTPPLLTSGISLIFSVPPGKCWGSTSNLASIVSLQMLDNLSFSNRPTIRATAMKTLEKYTNKQTNTFVLPRSCDLCNIRYKGVSSSDCWHRKCEGFGSDEGKCRFEGIGCICLGRGGGVRDCSAAPDPPEHNYTSALSIFYSSIPPRHYATSQKVADSIPDEVIGFFN
jgi:hypothetical protein